MERQLGKNKSVFTYILAISTCLRVVCMGRESVWASTTSDGVVEMKSDATTLNKGDTVQVDFMIHNTDTTGFSGYLQYDTNVFETLEEQNITVCDYVPEDKENQGEWKAVYSAQSQSLEVRWSGAKPVTLPVNTKDKVLSIKLKVKVSTASTSIRLNYPKVYRSSTDTDVINYPSGVEVTLKNSKTKKIALQTKDVSINANTVAVPISFTSNDGFLSLDIVTEFDKTKLQYQSVTVESMVRNIVSVASHTTESDGNKIITHIVATQEVKNIGLLFQVNFVPVKASGTQKTNVNDTTVKLSLQNVKDKDEVAFTTTSVTSKILQTSSSSSTTTVKMMGDINGNQKVDLVDALFIVQYYNKVRYFTDEQKAAADVNKNGTVDLVDALYIMQYYNGAIKSF